MTDSQLMQQALDTATNYFNAAIRIIDDRFGDDFAKNHPELIAAFMRTAATDFHTSLQSRALDNLTDVLDK